MSRGEGFPDGGVGRGLLRDFEVLRRELPQTPVPPPGGYTEGRGVRFENENMFKPGFPESISE